LQTNVIVYLLNIYKCYMRNVDFNKLDAYIVVNIAKNSIK